MLGLGRLSIQSKLILLLLAVSLSSIGVIAWMSYRSGREALLAGVRNQLSGMRMAKSTALRSRLEAVRDQVISMSDSAAVIEGTQAFRSAWQELGAKTLTAEEEGKLKDLYVKEFLPGLAKQVEGEPVLEQYLPTAAAEKYLQYHYIAANPQPFGERAKLETAPGDATAYGAAHAKLHKLFERSVRVFGFADIMLVDAKNLEIIYTYQKTTELATNLENGPYADTKLGAAVRVMRTARDRDSFKLADFEPYRPNLGLPMGFAMSPIFDGAQMAGILVLQFPIDEFNAVVTGNFGWREEGLGETGETYLVGPDRTMRSRSRFMKENPEGFVKLLREAGRSPAMVNQIERQGNVLCALVVDTPPVVEALKGKSGIMQTEDYRGEPVVSAYGPLEMNSLRWAVIAEMDVGEAQAPVRELGRKVVTVASAMGLGVSLLALMFANLLTRPLRLLTKGAKRLGAGETDVKVELNSRDEFGDLGRVFNEMADSIRVQKEKLEQQVRENQELLLNILPASAIAQRQEGDEKASRQFADVSVLFSDVEGLEDLSAKVGESKSLSLLGDLISAFDESAEKLGIEKVRTIGGSYLAVCGLSVNRPDHARRIVRFAQEMTHAVAVFNREHQAELQLTVGVNSGPVVGGVVGRRKFLYDLWGDTVNIARKLAFGHQGDAILVTAPMRERLGDQFQFSGPRRVEVEGKAALEAWNVVG
jgi:class 3 adenylate cyclase